MYNNKWNGKGYDENGNVIYELINGNGYKKEYNPVIELLIYEGECLNGKFNGNVKEYSNGKLYYECEYLNEKEMENIRNIIKMVKKYMKENI